MRYRRRDVVYGDDPFKGGAYARPWLVISNETHPFHGEQYVVLALTTKTWHEEFLEIPADAWVEGGTPKRSRIVPWSVDTLDEADVDFRQGTLERGLVDRAVSQLTSYVEPTGTE